MKVLDKAEKKKEFGKLIQEVYEKNENIEYIKKKKKPVDGDDDYDDYEKDEFDEDLSEISKDNDIDEEFNKEFFDKDEAYEQQALEIRMH